LPKKQFVLLGGDIILIIASFYLAPAIRFGAFLDLSVIFDWPDLSAIFIYLLSFYIFDFYNLEERFDTAAYVLRFLVALVAADLFVATLFYVFNIRPYATVILFLNTLLISSFCLGWRFLYERRRRETRNVYRTLIVGAGCAGHDLYEMLSQHDDFMISGILDDDPKKWGADLGSARVLGGTKLLSFLLDKVDVVIVAITHSMDRDLYRQLVEAKMQGITVYEMPTFYERVLGKIPVRHVSDLWFVYVPISGVRRSLYNVKIKKIIDIFLSLFGLLVTLPFTLPAILAIWCSSRGPVFYVHRRIGWNGQPFNLIKLRTMKDGFENDRRYAGQKDDPRITRVGRVIRFFRIDEIPQMWNVIRGDMSFIGPRALIEAEVEEFAPQIPYFSLRHSIRPGITGWAQVNYPHGATVEDALAKLEYDLFYIKNLSPLLDLLILARTVRTVLFGKGAR
jgi:exopolysaccharide biosynthesis polyprenyl glycosylphosphotransferase